MMVAVQGLVYMYLYIVYIMMLIDHYIISIL